MPTGETWQGECWAGYSDTWITNLSANKCCVMCDVCVCVCVCVCMCMLVTQLCLTLCNPIDYSLSGACVHEILQARILEWVALPFSKGYSQRLNPGVPHHRQILYHLLRKPLISEVLFPQL